MSHRQNGFATAELYYDMYYTEEYEERRRVNFQSSALRELKRQRGFHQRRFTYYAVCRRNETGDDKVSQWYTSIARPAFENRIAEEIRYSNESSQRRAENWREMHGQAFRGNLVVPGRFIYDEFDASLVRTRKPYCAEKPPENDKAERLEWLPSAIQYQRGQSPRLGVSPRLGSPMTGSPRLG